MFSVAFYANVQTQTRADSLLFVFIMHQELLKHNGIDNTLGGKARHACPQTTAVPPCMLIKAQSVVLETTGVTSQATQDW